ncbi:MULTISPECIES: hypothetical protein [unclassified Sinorhizobium]|uniref:hypothetical protein n=1 Tax=unclassified Sinorhizobium TaxID=2613772 RepID=UPI00352493C9
MQVALVALAALLAATSGAFAQEAGKGLPLSGSFSQGGGAKSGANASAPAAEASMADLVSRGYEIKTAVPNGGKFIVFMQKDQSAYACEFSSLTNTRCGSIN